jgi:uncharacterized membrane protein YbaN (DUF454 family)
MKHRETLFGHSLKLVAALAVLTLVAIGLLGLLLPIIPGLLFLGIATVIAAHYFPGVDAWLHRNRTVGRFLDRARLIWRARTQSSKSKYR